MTKLTATTFWNTFYKQHPNVGTHFQTWSFGDHPAQADELVNLVLIGKKRATSSLYELYRWTNIPLPKVGTYSVILDGNQAARCLIQTTKVEVMPYRQVSAAQAQLEGEGDCSLSYWRKQHWQFFTHEAKAANHHFTADDLVVCERFKLVVTAADLRLTDEKNN